MLKNGLIYIHFNEWWPTIYNWGNKHEFFFKQLRTDSTLYFYIRILITVQISMKTEIEKTYFLDFLFSLLWLKYAIVLLYVYFLSNGKTSCVEVSLSAITKFFEKSITTFFWVWQGVGGLSSMCGRSTYLMSNSNIDQLAYC